MLIKLGLTLIRIQRERWMERGEGRWEREREKGGGERENDGDKERKRNIRENQNWQSHSRSEPHSCLFRPVTCCKMTHALTGWICLDASHMKHKRESSP